MENFLDLRVLELFNEINKIPRESGNEKGISDYIVSFAKKNNLEYIQDDSYNVIIKKKPVVGYENEEPYILQAHMDMVCVKKDGSTHDFKVDPIEILQDGDYIKAKDTTLGADNGIGVAIMLAVLEDTNINHPHLECIFTVEEETTMKGAKIVPLDNLKGRKIIGLDHTTEGEILISSASMVELDIRKKLEFEDINDSEYIPYKLTLKGLLGGHSGDAINLNRANSICVLNDLLDSISALDIRIVDIYSGTKVNVIPSVAEAIILIKEKDAEKLEKLFERYIKEIRLGFPKENPEITIGKADNRINNVITKESFKIITEFIKKCPNGVYTLSDKIEGLTESSDNIGTLCIKNNVLEIGVSIRSSVKSLEIEICDKIKDLCNRLDFDVETKSEAPAMEYKEDSELRPLCQKIYKQMYNKEMESIAIHAGVEAGVFASRIEDADIVLISPNLYDIHTTDERASISSVKRIYEYLLEVLKYKE